MNPAIKDKARLTFKKIISASDIIVSTIILATIIILLVYMIFRVAGVYLAIFSFNVQQVLHELAFLVVFVKAYRLMVFYLESHYVSIKYIMEISIIAPAIDIIFANASNSLEINILFAVFSISNLILYLIFYKKLWDADDDHLANILKTS